VRAEHLYVHVPFCARRCVYCDFSIAVRSRIPEEEFIEALRRELEVRHADSELVLYTLYLGGGTPSRLSPDGVERVLETVRGRAQMASSAEITVEANPDDVSPERAAAWRRAGVNRVSLGIQSFEPRVLSWMHRTHTAEQGVHAVEILRDADISEISVDLIFALPADLGRSWAADLDKTLGLEVPHVSVYGLTVESRTPLGRWVARREVVEAPEESFEREFLEAHDALTAAGYEHYEVSNYARSGHAARHNSAYWRRTAYVGLGPSAHEFDGRVRRWNVAPYSEWVRRLRRSVDPRDGQEQLGPEQEAAEKVYLGLRTSEGLDISDQEGRNVSRWLDAGWARLVRPNRLQLTALGWLRLDALSADLTNARSRY
jgi:oxygen-independent coproporphyrinogen III oxidase